MSHPEEQIAFRNPIEAQGFARLSHLIVIDPDLSDGAVRLYARLLFYARQNPNCWPRRDTLAKDLNVSVPTIRRRLAELTDRGLITRQRRPNTSAITWIEDLNDAYPGGHVKNDPSTTADEPKPQPVKSDPSGPVKSDPTWDASKMTHKEETEEDTREDVGDDHTKQQGQSMTLLTALGVTRPVAAKLANQCPFRLVQGWTTYAQRTHSLSNPAGFVVHQLQQRAPLPAELASSDHHPANPNRRPRDIDGPYGQYIQH